MINNKYRSSIINLSVLILSILIFLSIMEVVLRIIEPKPKYKPENEFKFYEYSDYLGWRNRPLANGTFYTYDSKSYVNINSKGLRDYEHSYNKSRDIRRIEFLGDSFTWGYGVGDVKRFTNIFANELNRLYPNRFEIINMGTSGYDADQQLLLLKNEGVKYNPDIVVIAYHNDASFLGAKEAYGYPRPYFKIENNKLKLMNVPVPKRNVSWEQRFYLKDNDEFWSKALNVNYVLANLKSYVFLRDRLLKIQFVREKILGPQVPEMSMGEKFKMIDLIMLEAEQIAREKNFILVIVLIPDKRQVYEKYTTTEEIDRMVEFGKKNDITVINLLPDLKNIGNKNKDLYFVMDGHLSETGNDIVGKLLMQKFIQSGIIS